ncbi:anti-phage ATPase IteA [Achromobacter dolens]|uniref:anti-phage ATPase IteA n=1 Tax=Achromobacter dolens TaxID=1287738 RepID=UPI0014699017|nr:anti-phage ATPase IteA [Achromobacter dolens]CAB3643376.1 ATP-dependent zinc metalloprotease FtsH [Achromobacter dolens]
MSEVVKILEGALRANASMAANYAGLLADKLEAAGERRQASLIRERLARAPLAVASAQDGSLQATLGTLPVDGESRLHTVDISMPHLDGLHLLLPDAIERRLQEFVDGVEHHEQLVQAGAALPSRILIYGPPGTGKTQTARWIAARLKLQLLTVRCDTLVSSLLGQTSRNLRRVMDYAQQRPCVLFLDEFDALAGARGNERDIGELQRVVIALLQNIDALPDETILVAATNHEALLDPAVWRRFSFRVPMPFPDIRLRAQLWAKFLGDYSPSTISFEDLATLSESASGALIEQVCLDAKRSAVISGCQQVDKTELLRRLGLALALNSGTVLSTNDAEIHWLRVWDPHSFPLRDLARIYNVSVRHVSNVLKREHSYGGRKGKGK